MSGPLATYTLMSTGTTTAALVSSININANYFRGDGSAISNLARTSFAPYTIPWMAMEQTGSLNVLAGTWLHGGLISPNSLSVITTVKGDTFAGNYATFKGATVSSLIAPIVCSIYISTKTLVNETNFFGNQFGSLQMVASSFMSSLWADNFRANILNVTEFVASTATFGYLKTGTWDVDNLQSDVLTLLDQATQTRTVLSLSAATLHVSGISIYKNIVSTLDLVSTTSNFQVKLNVLSNFLNPFPALSAMSTTINLNFITLQTTASSLSTSLADSVRIQNIAISNVSVGLQTNIVNLSNFNVGFTSNVSTGVSDRFAINEAATTAQFIATSNYFKTSTTSLFIGLSTSSSNLSTTTYINNSNLSTVTGQQIAFANTSLSSLFTFTSSAVLSTFSTLSTQIGLNFKANQLDLSTSISNLSVMTDAKLYTLSSLMFSSFSTLQVGTSTISTTVGSNMSTLQLGLSTASSNLSTQGGINLLFLQIGLSTVSTTVGSNMSTLQLGLSTTSSNLSTQTGFVFSTLQQAISTLSTTTGSNISTLQVGLSTASSNLSTQGGVNLLLLQIGISTVSTTVGSNMSTLQLGLSTTTSNLSTQLGFTFSTLQLAISTMSTIEGGHISTLRVSVSSLGAILSSGFSTLSTTIGSNTSSVSASTLAAFQSTGISFTSLSNASISAFSTLSTTIGLASNFLAYSSTLSTQAGWNFSTLALGLSSLSTGFGSYTSTSASIFSTNSLLTLSLSSGNAYINTLSVNTLNASTVSTTFMFSRLSQGSTISSLTQDTGTMKAISLTVSSYKGNLGDAPTMLIQTL